MSKKNHKTTCQQCGKEFLVQRWRLGKAKYCSYECSNIARTTSKNTSNSRKCIGCKKSYIPTAWNQKWCSRECFLSHSKTGKRSKPAKCVYCKKEFKRVRKRQRFCSRECSSAHTKAKAKKKFVIKNTTLDILWAKIIKLKANNKCEYCGNTTNLNSHHIFSRINFATRWDINNGVCLCVSHHIFGKLSAHKAPIEFVEWLKEKRGESWYNALRQNAKVTMRKIDKSTIKTELEELYNNMLEEFENGI